MTTDMIFGGLSFDDGIRLDLGVGNEMTYHSFSSSPGRLSGVGRSIDAAIRVPKSGELEYATWTLVLFVKRKAGFEDDADSLQKAASNVAAWATAGTHAAFTWYEDVGEDEPVGSWEERYILVTTSCESEVFVPGRSVKITLKMQGYYEGGLGSETVSRIKIGDGENGQGGTAAADGVGRAEIRGYSRRIPTEVRLVVVTRSDDDHIPFDASGRPFVSIMGLCHDPITAKPLEVRFDASTTTRVVYTVSGKTAKSTHPSGTWAPEFADPPSLVSGSQEISWRGIVDGVLEITYKYEVG